MVSVDPTKFENFITSHGEFDAYVTESQAMDGLKARTFIENVLKAIIQEINYLKNMESRKNAALIAKRATLPGIITTFGLGLLGAGAYVTYLTSKMPDKVSVSCGNENSDCYGGDDGDFSLTNSTDSDLSPMGHEGNGAKIGAGFGAAFLYIFGAAAVVGGVILGGRSIFDYCSTEQRPIKDEQTYINHLVKLFNIFVEDDNKQIKSSNNIKKRHGYLKELENVGKKSQDLLNTLNRDKQGKYNENSSLLFARQPDFVIDENYLKRVTQNLLTTDGITKSSVAISVVMDPGITPSTSSTIQ